METAGNEKEPEKGWLGLIMKVGDTIKIGDKTFVSVRQTWTGKARIYISADKTDKIVRIK